MRRRLVAPLLVLLVAGCGARRDAALDASLPDGAAIEAVAAVPALEAFAASSDPRLRASALSTFTRALPWPDVERWVTQGTYDPDPWVQQEVAEALFDRGDDEAAKAALVELALRGSADPYVRARIAHRLLDAGERAALEPLREGYEDRPDWRAAPLALVAARLGNADARATVERSLAENEVRDDRTFVVDLGRFGWPDLVAAIAKGAAVSEDETGLRMALAGAMLGDPASKAAWAATLRRRDAEIQREALDLVRAMPPAVATPWLKQLAASPDRSVRLAVATLRSPSTASIGHALAASDPYARAIGAHAATRLPPDEAAPLLRTALADPDPDVRIAAAEAVGRLHLVALADALQPLVVDDRASVRVAAQGARFLLEHG